MVNRLLLRKLWRDIRQRKGSLLALVFIVAVGVSCYVGMAAVYRDMDGSRERYYREQRLADFTVTFKRAPRPAVEALADLPNVRAVRGRANTAVLIDIEGREAPTSGIGLSLPAGGPATVTDILLRSGVRFSADDVPEVIADEAFALANGLKPGDRIGVTLPDGRHDLLVVGTAMSPEFVYLIPPGGGLVPDPERFGVLYLPERFMQQACDLDGAFNEVVGLALDASPAALRETLALIERRLEAYGVTSGTPVHDQASVRFLAMELHGVKVTAAITPVIVLGLAALVLNVLLGRIAEQQRTVIGTLKAMGYGNGAVFRHYLGYGIAVGTLGGLAGILLGGRLQEAMVVMYRKYYALPDIRAGFYPAVPAIGFAVSLGFAVLGTVKGVRRAIRLSPAEAMRPPPPESCGRVLPEVVTPLWRILSFREKMIVRAVFRNPFRSGVSLAATAISTSLIIYTLGMLDSIDFMMNREFARAMREDVTVALREPVALSNRREALSLPGVTGGEGQLGVACDISRGSRTRRVAVTGLSSGSRLCTPLDRQGRPIPIPARGLVFSRKLAELLGAEVGDSVLLRPLTGRRVETRALVVGLADTYLGTTAYANLDYLSGLLGEEEVANAFALTVDRGVPTREFLREVKRRPAVVGIGERIRALLEMERTFDESMGAMIVIMVFFSGGIAFGSVFNAAMVSLSERAREVGTLRVLGYTPLQVTAIFAGESLMVNSVGVALGAAGGVGLIRLLALAYDSDLYRLPVVVRPQTLLVGALLMSGFLLLAQLIVYRMVRRQPWQDAMKVRE